MPTVTQRVSAQSEGLSGDPYDQFELAYNEVDGDVIHQTPDGFIVGTSTPNPAGGFNLATHSLSVVGVNIQYFGQVPVSGTVTSVRIMRAGSVFSGSHPPSGSAVVDIIDFNIDIASNFNIFVQFSQGNTQPFEDFLASLPYKYLGSTGDDTFTGGNNIDDIRGDLGNDVLLGGANNDKLYGQDGNDTLNGGAGADYLSGGGGNDTASYAGSAAAVKVNLADVAQNTGDAVGDTYNSIENLTGTGSADTLIGNAAANVLSGGSGNDKLFGQDGNDTLFGGTGADYLSGGTGSDAASYTNAAAGLTVSLSNPAINTGDAAGDTFNSIENLRGSRFDDSLNGNSAANRLEGGNGSDTLKGYAGIDILTGGSGNDAFVFNTTATATNYDSITDMNESGDDTIQLENSVFTALVGPEMTTLSSDQFISNATGTATTTDQRIIHNTTNGGIYYDTNGSDAGGRVLIAKVDPGLVLTNADFLVI